MKQAYINKIEYYLPPKQENNINLLKMAGKDNYKINRCLTEKQKQLGVKLLIVDLKI